MSADSFDVEAANERLSQIERTHQYLSQKIDPMISLLPNENPRYMAGRKLLNAAAYTNDELKDYFALAEDFKRSGDGLEHLRFSLWSLLHYRGFDYLKYIKVNSSDALEWKWDAIKKPALFQKMVKVDHTQFSDDQFKSMPALFYALFNLGKNGVPMNIPDTRKNIEKEIEKLYFPKEGNDSHSQEGLLTPILLITLGRTILEWNYGFSSFSYKGVPYWPASRYAKTKKESDQRYKRSRKSMVLVARHLKKALEKCEEETRPCPEIVTDIAYLTFLEYRSIISFAYEIFLKVNVKFDWKDPYHIKPEEKFNSRTSEFIKNMNYFGRAFVRLGTIALSQRKHPVSNRSLCLFEKGHFDSQRRFKWLTKIQNWWRGKSYFKSEPYKFVEKSWLPLQYNYFETLEPEDLGEKTIYTTGKFGFANMPSIFTSEISL